MAVGSSVKRPCCREEHSICGRGERHRQTLESAFSFSRNWAKISAKRLSRSLRIERRRCPKLRYDGKISRTKRLRKTTTKDTLCVSSLVKRQMDECPAKFSFRYLTRARASLLALSLPRSENRPRPRPNNRRSQKLPSQERFFLQAPSFFSSSQAAVIWRR